MRKFIFGAVLGLAGFGVSAPQPASAQDMIAPGLQITIGWDRGGYHAPRRHFAPPPPVYYVPPRRYSAPRRVYGPPPVYYAPPRGYRSRWDRPRHWDRPRRSDRPRYRHW